MIVIAFVQARMGSMRFPGKVIEPVGGRPLIAILLNRLTLASEISKIVLVTGIDPRNDPLVQIVEGLGVAVFRGDEDDVLDRFYQAAVKYKPDHVVRITGDCPLIDPELVDSAIRLHLKSKADYTGNVSPPTFPDGLDVEVFSFPTLMQTWRDAKERHYREHVTGYMRDSKKFFKRNYSSEKDCSDSRWTVDTKEDLQVIQDVAQYFEPNLNFGWRDVLKLEDDRPDIFCANAHLKRNQGSLMSSGQKLAVRAKRIIPGGGMLLSKKQELFLPGYWPTYFSRTEGCKVWDLDGTSFIDMSTMSVGTNTLGYSHPKVDYAVSEAVRKGNLATLNCPEEVFLAEKLVELHPWADMAWLARTGGEANAIAIRIARAASRRDNIAFCGYHGWHDWYLAVNLRDNEALSDHLIPGLKPIGVPKALGSTVFSFEYNQIESLEKLVDEHDIGVIKMEVMRNIEPRNGFLDKVRQLATRKGIVLIFDECTSGFRQTFGGLHKEYAVEPDMAVFGKALGNGYAITGIIGKAGVMECAKETFISSTFWTERIGPTAALKTLEVMEEELSWEQITKKGRRVCEGLELLKKNHGVPMRIFGLPALCSFVFQSPNHLEYRTLITQEFLKKGFLASNVIYSCTQHSDAIIDQYLEIMDDIFRLIAECEGGRGITTLLDSNVGRGPFGRVN
jgi:glutamate-1-semialdehyde 2,1-aminomutase